MERADKLIKVYPNSFHHEVDYDVKMQVIMDMTIFGFAVLIQSKNGDVYRVNPMDHANKI